MNESSLLNESGIIIVLSVYPGGGTTIGRWYGDVPRSWPPFSGQSELPSLPIYHQCAVHVPPFSIFRKFCIFSLVLGQNFSSQDPKFLNFRSQDPSVFKENPLLRPYFWKPLRHIPAKKKLSAPPRVRISWFVGSLCFSLTESAGRYVTTFARSCNLFAEQSSHHLQAFYSFSFFETIPYCYNAISVLQQMLQISFFHIM